MSITSKIEAKGADCFFISKSDTYIYISFPCIDVSIKIGDNIVVIVDGIKVLEKDIDDKTYKRFLVLYYLFKVLNLPFVKRVIISLVSKIV